MRRSSAWLTSRTLTLALAASSCLAACSILNAPGDVVPPGSGGAGGAGGEPTTSSAGGAGGAGGAGEGGGAGGGGAPPEPACGNGALEQGEECDDGDLEGGDACSAQCKRTVFAIAADAMLINDAPDVAPSGVDGGRGFLVVWRQQDAAVPVTAIVAATYGATGEPLGVPFVLGDSMEGEDPPRVAANADQRAVVAWIGQGDSSIRTQVVGPDGVPAPGGAQAIPGAQASVISNVATRSAGEFCLLWRTPLPPMSVLARCLDAQGSSSFTQTQTVGPSTLAGAPALWSAGSAFLAAWSHTDGTLKGLALSVAGVPQGAAFTIPSNDKPNQNPAGLQSGAMGGHVAVFEQTFGTGASAFTRVTKREFQNLGSSGVLDSFVSSSADHDEERPAVAAVNGKYVVAWADNDVNFGDIIAQAFNGDGTKLGPPIQVNKTDQAGTQQLARVAANADGDVMFVWQSAQASAPLKVSGYIHPRLLPP